MIVDAHLGSDVPMYIFGHLGTDHWWASLLYLLPVLIVVGGIAVTSWRDRRRGPDAEDSATAEDDAPTASRGPTAVP